ncbi:hypothetical protein [Corynebacterium variabile]|uniref:hypothetical protein n=1 Tax=Corynebacterium variabile TaxID=1727 RepID=UPI003FD544BD
MADNPWEQQWEYVSTTRVTDPAHPDWPIYEVEARTEANPIFGYDRLRIHTLPDENSDDLSIVKITIDHVTGTMFQRTDGWVSSADVKMNPRSPHLRALPIGRLLSQAALDVFRVERPVETGGETPPDFTELRAEWPKGDTDRVAKWAGWLYQRAVVAGDPANKAVQGAFDVSRRTAQRMIGMARERGYLPEQVVSASGPSRKRKEPHHEQGKD